MMKKFPPAHTIHAQAVQFLRENPGRWHATVVAERLGVNAGTVSAVYSTEYRKALAVGGAGVYGFRSASSPKAVDYAWCHSLPDVDDLRPFVHRPRASRVRRRSPKSEELTLTPSDLADNLWKSGEDFYRVIPVTVNIEVVVTEVNGSSPPDDAS